jgi:Tfp pilus assembly protein PilF
MTAWTDARGPRSCSRRPTRPRCAASCGRPSELYERSLAASSHRRGAHVPGWTWSFLGDPTEPSPRCKRAIEVDPSFGNPYNDIGAYLHRARRPDAAIPWLEQAKRATRYEAPQYPRFNLGRVYVAREMLSAALREFEEALDVQPGYEPAIRAIAAIKRRLN